MKKLKPFYKSKTFWANLIITIAAVIELIYNLKLLAAMHFILIIGILNILFRVWVMSNNN